MVGRSPEPEDGSPKVVTGGRRAGVREMASADIASSKHRTPPWDMDMILGRRCRTYVSHRGGLSAFAS